MQRGHMEQTKDSTTRPTPYLICASVDDISRAYIFKKFPASNVYIHAHGSSSMNTAFSASSRLWPVAHPRQ